MIVGGVRGDGRLTPASMSSRTTRRNLWCVGHIDTLSGLSTIDLSKQTLTPDSPDQNSFGHQRRWK